MVRVALELAACALRHSSAVKSTQCESVHNRLTASPLYLQGQFADSVVCQYLLVSDIDLERAKGLASSIRPVVLALDLSALFKVGDHHNGRRPLLPH